MITFPTNAFGGVGISRATRSPPMKTVIVPPHVLTLGRGILDNDMLSIFSYSLCPLACVAKGSTLEAGLLGGHCGGGMVERHTCA